MIAASEIDLHDFGGIVAAHSATDGQHLIFADGTDTHRVWVKSDTVAQSHIFIVIADDQIKLRLAAIDYLTKRLSGKSVGVCSLSNRPTSFRRHRLCQSLAILDALEAKARKREIATKLIYRQMPEISSSAWRDSNERRQTRRLINEARYLMQTGYRALINGG